MKVTRTNPSVSGMGCPDCGGAPDCFMSPHYGYAAAQSDRDQPGLVVNRSQLQGYDGGSMDISWRPPSQSSYGGYFGMGALGAPGTTATALANTTPDGPNPTMQTVIDSFSNTVGSAQPGVLQLDPNTTANNLSFVQPQKQSLQCQIVSDINSNPLLVIGGTFALFWLLSQGGHKVREYHARRKAARSAK